MGGKFGSLLVRVTDILNEQKAKRQTLTYTELAKKLGGYLPRSKWIAFALGQIAEVDHAAGKPLRSSLVVRSSSGLPGPGYFWVVDSFGLVDKDDPKACERFWRRQAAQLGLPV